MTMCLNTTTATRTWDNEPVSEPLYIRSLGDGMYDVRAGAGVSADDIGDDDTELMTESELNLRLAPVYMRVVDGAIVQQSAATSTEHVIPATAGSPRVAAARAEEMSSIPAEAVSEAALMFTALLAMSEGLRQDVRTAKNARIEQIYAKLASKLLTIGLSKEKLQRDRAAAWVEFGISLGAVATSIGLSTSQAYSAGAIRQSLLASSSAITQAITTAGKAWDKQDGQQRRSDDLGILIQEQELLQENIEVMSDALKAMYDEQSAQMKEGWRTYTDHVQRMSSITQKFTSW